ncbi:response regulator [Embleya sp. AB8]|uniref:response regulator n=1 Tax=Embleya sp. AB8 TaxID=3156304 RepID=UPI003C71E04B
MTIRVLVADDQHLVRAGFRGLVDSEPDLTVIGEADTGSAAVDLARRELPDVVLMDIRMPDIDGIEATTRITGAPETAGVRVLILTTFDLDEYVYAALRGGASGFLLKDTRPVELLDGIRVVARGDALLAPSVTRSLIREFAELSRIGGAAGPTRSASRFASRFELPASVTEREREVLALIGAGLSNPEICARLHISPGTTKAHVGHLLAKLAARDRVHLVIAAYRSGLVGLD